MQKVMDVATYIIKRYQSEYKQPIDEMKLHKLMYFAQRESFVQINEPLFDATFYGWKYGPVLKEVRSAYKDGTIKSVKPPKISNDQIPLFDRIFEDYSVKDSWSLSRLTHGELSWKRSREGISEAENSDNPICTDDIRKDADRIRMRRKMLAQLGLA